MKKGLLVVAAIAGTLLAGCRRGTPEATAPAAGKASAKVATDRNACHLLTHEEVSALVERKVTMADQTEAGDTFSSCDWEDESGTFAFGLTVYWSGGKEQWETWRLAAGLGDAALKHAEGVEAGAVVLLLERVEGRLHVFRRRARLCEPPDGRKDPLLLGRQVGRELVAQLPVDVRQLAQLGVARAVDLGHLVGHAPEEREVLP